MKTLVILTTSLLLLSISNCSINSNQEIRSVVYAFFKNTQNHSFETIDRTLLTQDLSTLIEKAIARTKIEEDKVKGSSDKPLCIEGDIFSSLYEGCDSFKVSEIKIKGNKAIVTIEFTFTLHEDKQIWKDEVILIKEKKWKIDNVIFKARKDGGSTKEYLLSFINY